MRNRLRFIHVDAHRKARLLGLIPNKTENPLPRNRSLGVAVFPRGVYFISNFEALWYNKRVLKLDFRFATPKHHMFCQGWRTTQCLVVFARFSEHLIIVFQAGFFSIPSCGSRTLEKRVKRDG